MTAPEKPDVGSDFDFTITATNNGPSDANNVVLSDYVPYGTEFRSVTSSDSSDICEFKDYPEWATPAEEGRDSLMPASSLPGGHGFGATDRAARPSPSP